MFLWRICGLDWNFLMENLKKKITQEKLEVSEGKKRKHEQQSALFNFWLLQGDVEGFYAGNMPFEVPIKICSNLAVLNAFVKLLFAHAQKSLFKFYIWQLKSPENHLSSLELCHTHRLIRLQPRTSAWNVGWGGLFPEEEDFSPIDEHVNGTK